MGPADRDLGGELGGEANRGEGEGPTGERGQPGRGGGGSPGSNVSVHVALCLEVNHGGGELRDEAQQQQFGDPGALRQQVAPQLGRDGCHDCSSVT